MLWSKSSVLRHMCANLENIFKICWDQEEVVFRVIYATQGIAKEGVSIVRKFGKHSPNSLSMGGDVFLVLPMHHQG